MLLLLITTVISITFTDALDCYKCTNITSTADCHHVVVCQAHEKCFTQSIGSGDTTTYTLGCKHEDQCSTVSPVSLVGRATTNQSCSQCCSVDACNKVLCSTGDPNGRWSAWSTWGTCTVTCGTGLKSRTRVCDNPSPSQFGQACFGNNEERDLCNQKACPAHHVAFSVNTPNGTLLNNYAPVFLGVTTNLGGGYNPTNGIFTCPVAGLYQFSLYIRVHAQNYAFCAIRHNGKSIVTAETDNDVNDTASVSTYLLLALGDTVNLACGQFENVSPHKTGVFNGALIQAD